jgi:hypothetical protein
MNQEITGNESTYLMIPLIKPARQAILKSLSLAIPKTVWISQSLITPLPMTGIIVNPYSMRIILAVL